MQTHRVTRFSLLLAVAPLMCAAGEGALEINQACAESNGCFSGDAPGFPVEISQSGSYVLTGGLTLSADTTAIEVSADRVSIDLRGHSIEGPVTCSGEPVTSCDNLSSPDGIAASGRNEITISHGRISGFGGSGIIVGARATLEALTLSDHANDGIFAGADAIIRNVRVQRSADYGLRTGVRANIRDVQIYGNGGRGLEASSATSVTDVIAFSNGDLGLFVGRNSTLRGISAMNNQGDGVMLYNGGSIMVDSASAGNAGFGVNCLYGQLNGLRSVVLNNNNSDNAQFSGTCSELGTNVCENSTTCP